jgi:hypothetical protein
MTEPTAFRPVLRTQADVERFWTTICRPLGWRTPELWVVLVDGEGRPFPSVQQITDLTDAPDEVAVARLLTGCRRLLDELDPGGRAAMLLCRPGPRVTTAFDRAWRAALAEAARREGVEMEVMHVASDATITPLPLDSVA